MEIYVYLNINDPTNVIKIDHPKNNGKVDLLLATTETIMPWFRIMMKRKKKRINKLLIMNTNQLMFQ